MSVRAHLHDAPQGSAAVADAGEPTEGADGIIIRRVRTHDEYVACYELQMATWGQGFREAVPTTILKVSQRLGGVTAGAFGSDGSLLGFVFGMTGVEHGAIVHWSDMLAVHPSAQNHGIGRRLKEFQRDALRRIGATKMYWTYDPLVARNAHFNLNRLGARVHEYVQDMYGADTGSAIHSGVGTDRFIVVWPIASTDRPPTPSARSELSDGPLLNPGVTDGRSEDPARIADGFPSAVRVEIPTDIAQVQAESAPRAAQWRSTSRRAIQWALANGYMVDRMTVDEAASRAFYVLTRAGQAPHSSAAAPTPSAS